MIDENGIVSPRLSNQACRVQEVLRDGRHSERPGLVTCGLQCGGLQTGREQVRVDACRSEIYRQYRWYPPKHTGAYMYSRFDLTHRWKHASHNAYTTAVRTSIKSLVVFESIVFVLNYVFYFDSTMYSEVSDASVLMHAVWTCR